MNAIAAPKSRRMNLLEGMALTALLQAIPTFGAAVLLLNLVVSQIAGAAIFVATATLIHALATPWLGPKFPRFFKSAYEPLFFNAMLSFTEKLSRWRAQPATPLQLVTNVTLVSLLAVGWRVWSEGSRDG